MIIRNDIKTINIPDELIELIDRERHELSFSIVKIQLVSEVSQPTNFNENEDSKHVRHLRRADSKYLRSWLWRPTLKSALYKYTPKNIKYSHVRNADAIMPYLGYGNNVGMRTKPLIN